MVDDLQSSLKFGTSGLRGPAAELKGDETRRYVTAFLRYLAQQGEAVSQLYLARDFRDSSAEILSDCAAAAAALGIATIDCGAIPTPALALHAMAGGAPSVMVTGSHIPEDRNGLKFYLKSGEISKDDEAGILAHLGASEPGDYATAPRLEEAAALERYHARYASLLTPGALAGLRIGVFEHTTVARDFLGDILKSYGAETVGLGRADKFVAVDTEAFSDAVFAPLPGWMQAHRLDAIVSADGDGDRPLLMDNEGRFVRGDVLGLLAAEFLGADTVVTPVTSNTAIEATGYFAQTARTRVGSPYVIAGMVDAIAAGSRKTVGFEANGGTLVGNTIAVGDGRLSPLMTRDAVLPLLAAFGLAQRKGVPLSVLVERLPLCTALSGRLADVPAERSAALLAKLRDEGFAASFFAELGKVIRVADIDGLQFWLDTNVLVHVRPSGNAPELRCYVEAQTAAEAEHALGWALGAAGREVGV